ncbi:hypothetical protein [Lentibacillus sp. CBA3610]|uniref:hypothetical protein n=1 Tax=Lentibacillus sp. CBA3610 TaxID=2518176 RepID=UPI0015950967|nr:hypothetical protein [Lentibacillus sp. CBA3610]QKY70684.1 hypothetical protein Len3610_14750 [Lentibacillus sp. CBA3610]
MILALSVTVLLIYDYFPGIPFADAVPLEVLILVMLGLFMVTVYRNRKHNPDQKIIFRSQVFFLIYIVALMALLTALGGESQVGIAFDKGIFWAALAIAIMEISFQWRRMKQVEE